MLNTCDPSLPVFPKYEIAVISRAKSAVHKDIKVKNDEVRAKREPSLLQ